MKFIFVLLFSILASISVAQPLSPDAKFSLITCDPGVEVYSLHGHSAIRVEDPLTNVDVVFNWGMFDPGDSELDFSIAFSRGLLDYFLHAGPYDYFIEEYEYDKRAVNALELSLTIDQKRILWELLLDNNTPENKFYRYDFFFDNCATRIRDLLEQTYGPSFKWTEHPDANQLTLRNTIDVGLADQPWSDFGIDLGLGSKVDVKATNSELMFLPRYLQFAVKNATFNGESLIVSDVILLDFPPLVSEQSSINNPTFVFWTLLIVAAALVFLRLDLIGRIFDSLFFTIMGIAGLIIMFLWFGTEHTTTDSNYNLIWATPIHFIIPVLMLFKKKRNKLNKVFLALSIFYFVFVLFWFFLPQEFNSAAKPLILALGLR
ncbi:MAG: DUF4105 domain-containing protein, partial [Flavobacteriales bacterium]|nr:DUF4105 domain-containing protein [Flavobacteriales bacterium]